MKSINFILTIVIFFAHIVSNVEASKKDDIEENKNNFLPISALAEVKPLIIELLEKRNPNKTLIVMPLESVMFSPIEEGFKLQDENYRSLARKAFLKIRTSQMIYLNPVVLVEYENEMIDPDLPDLINLITENKAPIIVMTSNISGNYNEIPYLELWTIDFLAKHNINISKGVFSQKSIVLSEMTKIKGSYPTFYKGLLSCNSEKGENTCHQVLPTLLARMKFLPDTVVVIHTDVNFLNIVVKQLKAVRIDTDVIGVLYNLPARQNSSLSPNDYLAFISKFAEKVNNVIHTMDKNSKSDNPYEE